MTLDEAVEIIEAYHMWEDKSCTCHMGNPPCAKCTSCPTGEMYNEALKVFDEEG